MHAMPGVVASARKEQAARDWKSILQARSGIPGGRFCASTLCIQRGYLGQTDGASMWDSFQTAWDMLTEQNLIDEDERLVYSKLLPHKKRILSVLTIFRTSRSSQPLKR
jgi:hypothetical protein